MRTPISPTAPTPLQRLGFDHPHTQQHCWSANRVPLMVLVVCGQMAFSGVAQAAAAKDNGAKADAASVPTAYEVSILYADRTWIWKDGAAYFGKNGRSLRAWTSREGAASVGQGKWIATRDGKMCMDLAWRSKAYTGQQNRTCYSHRIKGGNIEQRKDPDGEWYSFKRSPEDPADEYRKFEPGDTKAAQFEESSKLIDSKN